MDDLETRLRDELTRVADGPAPAPGLADRVVARGRRARRARLAGAAAAVAVVVAAAGLLVPGLDRAGPRPAAPVTGPPRVPVWIAQSPDVVVDWPGGTERRRPAEGRTPLAATPSGVVLTGADGVWLLAPDEPRARRLLADAPAAAAVSADGRRLAVIAEGSPLQLREYELPTARPLRTVGLGPPLVPEGVQQGSLTYSGSALLMDDGEGPLSGVVLLEGGPGEVADVLDTWTSVRGGAPAEGGGPAGRAAFGVEGDDACDTAISRLTTGGGSWRLCREPFAGFSPDGALVLATDAVGEGLVVRDAESGKPRQRWETGPLRGYGWETAGTVLQGAVQGGDTVVRRCAVRSGTCAEVWRVPGQDVVPLPVPPAGG